MIVVSDTSCISNLLSVGQESLLVRWFGEVLIPPAVEQELLRYHKAKRSGLLSAVGPVQQLENDAGFRLAPSLKLAALRAVDEA